MAKSMYTNLDFLDTSKIVNLPNPSSAQDAATKAYVDGLVEGLAWKDSVRVSTQGNVNLSSPGSTIDGITMATNDRVLVRSQSTASQNGIYIWNGASSAMTRSLDCSTSAELEQAVVSVEEGTDADSSFRQTEINFTLDSGDVTWAAFGSSAPSASETTAGIAEIATQSETDTGTDDARFVTPLKLASYSGRAKRYAASVGDGSATQFTVTHNLGTTDAIVRVFANAGDKPDVECDIERTSTNAVRLTFASAPTSNQFRCVVIA